MNIKNILFVGTGGGNDVFSTTLAALSLWELGWRWEHFDVMGVLSPFHYHQVNSVLFFPFVSEVRADSKRFVRRRDRTWEIPFIDSYVAKMVEGYNPFLLKRSPEVFGLDIREGSAGTAYAFKQLAEGYDFFVLVDIGGDMFYRDNRDTHVLSPMFDACVLKGFTLSGAPGIVFEAGLGTDGEINHDHLKSYLTEAEATTHPLLPKTVNEWEDLYEKWIAPVRTGRTVPITIQAFWSQDPFLTIPYRARAHIGKTKLYHYFDQKIDTDMCRKFFLVDPKKIQNTFAIYCSSIWEWFRETQVCKWRTNCETNLEYVSSRNGTITQILTPSPLFPEHDAEKLIQLGITDLLSGVCHKSVMLYADMRYITKSQLDRLKITERVHSVILE